MKSIVWKWETRTKMFEEVQAWIFSNDYEKNSPGYKEIRTDKLSFTEEL